MGTVHLRWNWSPRASTWDEISQNQHCGVVQLSKPELLLCHWSDWTKFKSEREGTLNCCEWDTFCTNYLSFLRPWYGMQARWDFTNIRKKRRPFYRLVIVTLCPNLIRILTWGDVRSFLLSSSFHLPPSSTLQLTSLSH